VKIIFYNLNDLKIDSEGLANFIEQHQPTTDIFCFQETNGQAKQMLAQLFPQYLEATTFKWLTEVDYCRLVILLKPEFRLLKIDNFMEDHNVYGAALYAKILTPENEILHVINVHGISRPGNKLDDENRLAQSEAILSYMQNVKGPLIVGGDFNLDPTTNSITMFEDAGYVNLIKKYNINSTRNEVIWRKFPDNKQYFSDYVFVSKDVTVENFSVPYNEFSDHLPLLLDCTIK
jgi:endonuclease/exonuclease/phosphatase family metal-dependent hydrolase